MELVNTLEQTPSEELQPGCTLLQGQYTIERFLNSGGFGMTYLAKDSLNRFVVIKECFPGMICQRSGTNVYARAQYNPKQFKSITRHFIREAHRLAKLEHSNIVGVHQVFEDNETAYMALDFVDGDDLFDIVEDPMRRLGPIQIKSLMLTMLDAISYIHSRGLLHRDISPDNILLDRDGNPILIDFGAARENETETGRVLSSLLAVKEGYSPQEFYLTGSEQGPYSDLYALGATFYHLVSGDCPPNSQERLAAIAADVEDPYQPLATGRLGYDMAFLEAIDKSLELMPQNRFQSAEEWILNIDATKRKEDAISRAQNDDSIRATIRKLVAETNVEMMEEDLVEDAPLEAEAVPEINTLQKVAKPRAGALSLIASLLFGGSKRREQTQAAKVEL